MDPRKSDRLLAQMDAIADAVAAATRTLQAMMDEHPRPPTYERDEDAVEAAMASQDTWTCTDLARAAGIPDYRCRAALRTLASRERVEILGRTRGTRYRLCGGGT